MATDVGLYRISPTRELAQIVVDPAEQDLGFYSVVASRDVRGGVSVAVAAREVKGVFLSSQAGQSGTFESIGPAGKDVRVLSVQALGPNRFLWAGVSAAGDAGEGCLSWQLLGGERPVEGWRAWRSGWRGGTCWSIAFLEDGRVVAGTYSGGALWLDTGSAQPAWKAPGAGSGLPLREDGRFEQIDAVAADRRSGLVMAGGVKGLRRSANAARWDEAGAAWEDCSKRAFAEEVTLPPTWLFCDGGNEIEVRSGA
jgi:hypothetical protein